MYRELSLNWGKKKGSVWQMAGQKEFSRGQALLLS
jgi:hypothetical protein